MAYPIKICAICSEAFELKPGKPGFANRCPACSEPEQVEPVAKRGMGADEPQDPEGSERCSETSDAQPSLPQGQLESSQDSFPANLLLKFRVGEPSAMAYSMALSWGDAREEGHHEAASFPDSD